MSKLKKLLKTLSIGYEEGKKEHLAGTKADPLSLMTAVERVCITRECYQKIEHEEKMTSLLEEPDTETETSEDESIINSESTSMDESEEVEDDRNSSDDQLTSSSDKAEEDEVSAVQTEECVLLEDTSDDESDQNESDVITETWSSESDGSVNERCCYISSAANIRRRQMHGQKRYYQEEEPAPKKMKKKLVKKTSKKVDLASLKDIQKEVKDQISIDDRGLKKKNPKRAVASVEKWATSNMWQEIVDEGMEKSKHAVEIVRLLHIPDTAPAGRKDPEPPPGYTRVKFEPKTGGSKGRKLKMGKKTKAP